MSGGNGAGGAVKHLTKALFAIKPFAENKIYKKERCGSAYKTAGEGCNGLRVDDKFSALLYVVNRLKKNGENKSERD